MPTSAALADARADGVDVHRRGQVGAHALGTAVDHRVELVGRRLVAVHQSPGRALAFDRAGLGLLAGAGGVVRAAALVDGGSGVGGAGSQHAEAHQDRFAKIHDLTPWNDVLET